MVGWRTERPGDLCRQWRITVGIRACRVSNVDRKWLDEGIKRSRVSRPKKDLNEMLVNSPEERGEKRRMIRIESKWWYRWFEKQQMVYRVCYLDKSNKLVMKRLRMTDQVKKDWKRHFEGSISIFPSKPLFGFETLNLVLRVLRIDRVATHKRINTFKQKHSFVRLFEIN